MFGTIVSLMPFPMNQSAPGMLPISDFHIPANDKGEFSVLHVEDGWYHVYVDHERGSIKVPQSGETIAAAIVFDCKNTKPYGVNPGIAEPGIFFLPGKVTKEQVLKNHKDLLDAHAALQKKWFENLVADGDDLWNKFHQHRMISDTCRLAAKMLGLEREWNIQAQVENIRECPACTKQVPVRAIVCSSCRCIIDEARYKTLKFAEV